MRGVILGSRCYLRLPGLLSAQILAQMDSIETPITIQTLSKEFLEHALIYQQVVN